MSDLEPRTRPRPPRRTREQRAYRLVLASVALGAVAVVGFVLAIADVIGAGLPFLAAVLAAICGLLVRRAVQR